MPTFFNQASLSYNGRVTNSNVTEGEILSVGTVTKTAIINTYTRSSQVAYAVALTNTSGTPQSASVTDNLGAFTTDGETYVPLDYVEGTALLYINGVSVPVDVTDSTPLTFRDFTIPAGGSALLIYAAEVNEYAPLAAGSEITNTVTAEVGCGTQTAEATVTVRDSVLLTIAKAISPASVGACGEVTYTLVIQNSGNTAVVATDNVIVSDTFDPPLVNISVESDGEEWDEGVQYSYDEVTGEFRTLEGAITVPAATFTTADDGTVTVTPGVLVITITGNLS